METNYGLRVAALRVCIALSVTACASSGSHEKPVAAPADQIAVGYGVQARENISGSVASVRAEGLRSVSARSVVELLEGRVAGLQVVRRRDGDLGFVIRGGSSLVADSDPLIVIDGLPVRQGSIRTVLAGINPRDVARIDVLKDAASAAIYGSRSANGVILITTKRPR